MEGITAVMMDAVIAVARHISATIQSGIPPACSLEDERAGVGVKSGSGGTSESSKSLPAIEN